jgi:ribonuclease BN (tRNA processing enzyme)
MSWATLHIATTGSKGNLAALTGGAANLIFDAGAPPQALPEVDFSLPSVVLISHTHGDHYKFADDFRKLGCDVIMPEQAIGKQITMYGMRITAVEGYHDSPVAVYLLDYFGKFILYATDTAKLPTVVTRLDLAIVEANWTEAVFLRELPVSVIGRIVQTHLSVDDAVRWFKKHLPRVGILWHSSSSADLSPAIEELSNLPYGSYSIAKKGIIKF